MKKHYINTGILWFIFTFVLEVVVLRAYDWLPVEGSHSAKVVDEAFMLLVLLGTPVFTFVIAIMAYSLVNFRSGHEDETGEPIHGSDSLTIGWLFITLALAITVIIHPGLTGLADLAAKTDPEVTINVTGSQWAWLVEYEGTTKIVSRGASKVGENVGENVQMLLPLGRSVRFVITSKTTPKEAIIAKYEKEGVIKQTSQDTDVLHSFWIPIFRLKKDAVPGMENIFQITPKVLGSYADNPMFRVQCAELCGTNHFDMMLPIRVVPVEEFYAWLGIPDPQSGDVATAAVEQTPEQLGEAQYQLQGCVGCHANVDGIEGAVGPSWVGLYGKEETLDDGTKITVDDAYIQESIVTPNAKIVDGFFADIMPATFGDVLSEDDINNIIAYIKSLK